MDAEGVIDPVAHFEHFRLAAGNKMCIIIIL